MSFKNPDFRTKVIPNFYMRATEMRAKYVEFFATPSTHSRQHFVWDFWYVPAHYFYLRGHAEDILGPDLTNDFNRYMSMMARQIGYDHATSPLISVYTNGMHQTTHSDMMNGSLAYVFSLTDWANRKFDGGETMVARENVFDKIDVREHRGQTTYWEPFPAHFNQLLLFDDRLAHMVPVIQGQNDPLEARVVCHGHIR